MVTLLFRCLNNNRVLEKLTIPNLIALVFHTNTINLNHKSPLFYNVYLFTLTNIHEKILKITNEKRQKKLPEFKVMILKLINHFPNI